MISEKIQLLGKGMYERIPDELTVRAIPTTSELEYVGAEDFDKTMIESIFPVAIEEFASKEIDPYDLLELDYRWVCRCMRIVNYGPYYTTNAIYCSKCGKTSRGEYQVSLNTVGCVPFPNGFVNELKISRDEFIDFNGDIVLKLPTIRQILTAYKDSAFLMKNGDINLELARMCYMIRSIGSSTNLNPFEIKMLIQKEFSPSDYILLRDSVNDLTDYGLRAGGKAQCPNCGDMDAGFIALSDDRFFRPSVGDIRRWKADKIERSVENTTGNKASKV